MKKMICRRTLVSVLSILLIAIQAWRAQADERPNEERPNVVVILVDDLRYDAFSFMGHPFLETPHIDALARGGLQFRNAFVTTSLCSPARASFLTGQYAHHHRVVDNNDRMPEGTVTFPQLLQAAGYATAFLGKWHMGGSSDAPRPGFDHWVSFRGQGTYFPGRQKLNIDGKHVPRTKYITDELTDYAVRWIAERGADQPFLLYFSHKGVHGPYRPATRHQGRYEHAKFVPPATMADTPENRALKPMWVHDQRNSWHGVEFPYYGRWGTSIATLFKRYAETILSIDESVGRVMQALKKKGFDRNTLVLFTSDGGHLWGEHGLIDKRCAYEESMRIPMIAYGPGLVKPGTTCDAMIANIDLAPTLLEIAGVKIPANVDGQSFLKRFDNPDRGPDREALLYEYYWEYNFPQTPTTFALRTPRYKLIQYHGIWDTDELYDLANDPRETDNLVHKPEHRKRVAVMRKRLHERLAESGGLLIPLGYKRGGGVNQRSARGSKRARFPSSMIRDGDVKNAKNNAKKQ